MLTADARGHRFPSQRTFSKEPVSLTDADIYGTLEPLNVHGPLFTSYLKEFASFYRDTARYTVDRLGWFNNSTNIRFEGKLIGEPILDRPAQQFPEPPHTPKRRQMIIHHINPAGIRVLKQAGRYHPIKHGGWWNHQVANSCITASLHLGMLHDDVPFIPPDRITDDFGVTVPYTAPDGSYYDDHRLVLDYIFGAYRFHPVETDLANEVGRPGQKNGDTDQIKRRKSYLRMFLQYSEVILRLQPDGGKLYNKLFRIPREKGMMPLFVTTSESKLRLMEAIILELTGDKGCNWFLMKHVPAQVFSAHHSPKPLFDLWTGPWKRAGRSDFYINNPARQ